MIISLLHNGIDGQTIISVIAFLLAVLISISIHEYAHGYVAKKMGDNTAQMLGRLTLNPLAHLDIFGTLAFFIFGFGWAKPVPINPINFKEYRKGIFLTSIAGVVANLFVAFFGAGLYIITIRLSAIEMSQFLTFIVTLFKIIFYNLMFLNLQLAIFNLIPIAPLDGFNIFYSLTKEGNKAVKFLQKYGSYILIGLLIVVSLIEPYLPFLNGNSLMYFLASLIASPIQSFWIFGLYDLFLI